MEISDFERKQHRGHREKINSQNVLKKTGILFFDFAIFLCALCVSVVKI